MLEQLWLRLDTTKVPVDAIVIDALSGANGGLNARGSIRPGGAGRVVSEKVLISGPNQCWQDALKIDCLHFYRTRFRCGQRQTVKCAFKTL
jgi:hypothetical protein